MELPNETFNAVKAISQITGKEEIYIINVALEMLCEKLVEEAKKLKIEKFMC